MPVVVETQLTGMAYFKPTFVKKNASPFGINTLYAGTITHFYDGERLLKNLPCYIYRPLYGNHPKADTDYILEGRLIPKGRTHFVFKPKKWKKVKRTHRLAQMRYDWKKNVRLYLKRHVKDRKAFDLLTSLATGDLEDRSLKFEFGRLSLNHILAVSGFHFSLLALFLYILFARFLPIKSSSIVLLALLTLFFVYMGPTPSISRAWIGLALPLIGRLFGRECSPLNALSFGCLFSLAINPLITTHLGFALSYLATWGLISFTPDMERLINPLLPTRRRDEALKLSFVDKHLYLIATFLRKTLAINAAVTLTTLPLILFMFGKFPYIGIVYNLFYPLAVSFCLVLLLAALLCPYLFPLVTFWAKFLTRLVTYAPKSLDFYLYTPPFSIHIVLISLFVTILYLTKKEENSDNSSFYGDRSSVG